jgi:dihydrofolate reductase
VLTHHRHDLIQMGGGTTFHFVTEGFDAAYSAACEAAGDNGVDIAGGASTVRQALAAGVIDELTLDIAPVQAREQAATQHKLGEILQALPCRRRPADAGTRLPR